MIDLYTFFCGIEPAESNEKCFAVEQINATLPHRLGCSYERFPIFFVECSDEMSTTNIDLKLFSVNFNQVCNLNERGSSICKKYTIILLKSLESDMQKYFLDLIYIVLKKLPAKPTVLALKRELAKVISMFTAPPTFSKDIVQGLWAELFVIACGKNPLYLINSWHTSPEDKYDFNDGIDKVEVKATRNHDRIHTFAIEQLNPNKDSKHLIASIIVVPSGQGSNIFDLIDAISEKVTDNNAILKLKEVAYQTIGPHLEESKKIKFDISMAVNTYKLFNHYDVPAIPISSVPSEVSNVHFSSCLKDVVSVDTTTLQSKLHQAL